MIFPTIVPGADLNLRKKANDRIRAVDWNRVVERDKYTRVVPNAPFIERRNYDRLDFAMYMQGPAEVRVQAGYFTIDGYLDNRVAQTDVALTGNPEYVFLQYEWGAAAATIEHSSTLPVTNSTYFRRRFVKMSPSNGVYFIDELYHDSGSISLAAPLRGGT